MALFPGDKLGPYEILALVGKGGMGEVYRAHDSRLNRDVAIKVSNAQFTERFTREARAIAALNNTNICHLYDVGPNYLVMEYVEGPDLRGPLDFDDALPIIQQLIDGIEAAHEKNIVHRDLKPANIKITPEGVVKILDFGLAKALAQEGSPPPLSDGTPDNSPTLTIGATQAGAILGTAAYMAPEQAKGKQADKRSDIWSFGVIVYEVLTGKKLFGGETAIEILGAVLNRDPDISAAPTRVHMLLRWCLEKDRKQRLASISDARRLLAEGGQPAAAAQTASRKSVVWMAAAAVLAVVAAGGLAGWYRATRPAEPKPLVRLDVDLGADVSLPVGTGARGPSVILSPDGTRIVYLSQGKLFTRKVDQSKGIELPGTEEALGPFFSPDGQWVAFFSQKKLKKISIEGGAVVTLCDAPSGTGGAWMQDGNIIVALSIFAPLSKVSATGGPPVRLAELAKGEVGQDYPQVLPGGKAVLFTSTAYSSNADLNNIDVMTLAEHRRKTLLKGGTFGRYFPTSDGTGYLLYVSRATLFAVPFDAEKLEMRGTPVPVIERIAYSTNTGSAEVAFAASGTGSGTLLYRNGTEGTEPRIIQWMDSTGKTQPLISKPDAYMAISLSPDGERLVFDANDNVWIYDIRRDAMTKIADGERPHWTPDGRYIVYRKVGKGFFWTSSDGASKSQVLLESKNSMAPGTFTPDGKTLMFIKLTEGKSTWELWSVPVESDTSGPRAGKPVPFLQTQFNERGAKFSPDGHWVAYLSDESGQYEVYVRSWPDSGRRWQISSEGGLYPEFSPNGRELFFHSLDSRTMFTVNYTTKGDSFVADKPRVWSEKPLFNTYTNAVNYSLAPDGKRIVALMPVDTPESRASQSHVIFLENFADELRRKVPVGK